MPPVVDVETSVLNSKSEGITVRFDHRKEFMVHVTEEFLEHCAEGALSIEVWGHRSVGFAQNKDNWELEEKKQIYYAKNRSIMDR